jgi:hypothetical protein
MADRIGEWARRQVQRLDKAISSLLFQCFALLLLCCAVQVGISISAAQTAGDAQATERAVKAAFLYKFTGYVELPAASAGAPDAPFVIAVIGSEDIAGELSRITAGRTVGARPIQVRRQREDEPMNGIQMLFVAGTDAPRLGRILRTAQQRSILTVTDAEGGLLQGSVINFRLVDERVRFEVSLVSAEKSNIKLSSRMLSVAYYVEKGL